MNFLSHYYFANFSLTSPEYMLGLIYPDLSKQKIVRSSVDFQAGIDEHRELDRRFHNYEWFEQSCQDLVLAGEEFRGKYILSHIALELAIDTQLELPFEISTIQGGLSHMLRYVPEVEERLFRLIELLPSYTTIHGAKNALERTYVHIANKHSFPEQNVSYLIDDALDLVRPQMNQLILDMQ